MMNREKYKQAFSAIHISDEFTLEVKSMKAIRNKQKLNRLVAAIAACVLITGSAAAAYTTDFGGMQRKLQLWIQGDQTEVDIHFDGKGGYSMGFSDEEGDGVQQNGGGVSVGADGSEAPLSEEELMEQLTSPEVEYKDDGSVWVYWFDQKIDISNRFKNNACYIRLVNGKDILYMTVTYQNGFSTSPHKYLNPAE